MVIVADFTADTASGYAPLSVSFSDASTGSPTGWTWFFGEWVEQTTEAEWIQRNDHATVTLPDGSIVLMGGWREISPGTTAPSNDVWRSSDNGKTWVEQTASAEWESRARPRAVALPDGSIVLVGGINDTWTALTDVWRSTDKGAHWIQMTAVAEWSARDTQSVVSLPDGSIVLTGGKDASFYSLGDVWRSTDKGATWVEMTASAEWDIRSYHTSVSLSDGSIIVMGGYSYVDLPSPPWYLETYYKDVWRSTNNGATWVQMTDNAGWGERSGHNSVSLIDNSIVLIGGWLPIIDDYTNDVWRSTDMGATWTRITEHAGWSVRYAPGSVALSDGSIVLTGGNSNYLSQNDVWIFQLLGSVLQNPIHTYATPGIYSVTLQAYDISFTDTITKTDYITVLPAPPPPPRPMMGAVSGDPVVLTTGGDTVISVPTTTLWNVTTYGG